MISTPLFKQKQQQLHPCLHNFTYNVFVCYTRLHFQGGSEKIDIYLHVKSNIRRDKYIGKLTRNKIHT